MRMTAEEIGRLGIHIYDDIQNLVGQCIAMRVREFAAQCESPIEVLFGVAFHLCTNLALPGISRRTHMFLHAPGRTDHDKLAPAQWKIVPQYQWESYRIDFAIFTELEYPVFVECDGHNFHERTKEQAARDREKDRRIQAAGIPIMRFTGSEIHASPQRCAFDVYMLIDARARALNTKAAG